MKVRFLAAALAVAALLPAPARAQEQTYPTPAVPPGVYMRLAALESDVVALKDGQAKQAETSAAVLAAVNSLRTDLAARPAAPAKAEPPVEKQWRVATLPGYYTEAQLRAIYPAIRFPHDPPAASGVAAADPFARAAGCGTTVGMTALRAATAATPPTFGPARSPAVTYTLAPGAGSAGITSGCANGACAAPTTGFRRGVFR